MSVRSRALTSLVMATFFAACAAQALSFRREAAIMPLLLALPGFVLSLVQFWIDLKASKSANEDESFSRQEWIVAAWLVAFTLAIIGFGFTFGATVLVAAYLHVQAREGWLLALAGAVLCFATMYGLERLMNMSLFEGLIIQYIF